MLKGSNSQFLPGEYLGRYEAVLVDSSCINVLSGVPLTSIEMVSAYLGELQIANLSQSSNMTHGLPWMS